MLGLDFLCGGDWLYVLISTPVILFRPTTWKCTYIKSVLEHSYRNRGIFQMMKKNANYYEFVDVSKQINI
jgi:hypothetical protein